MELVVVLPEFLDPDGENGYIESNNRTSNPMAAVSHLSGIRI